MPCFYHRDAELYYEVVGESGPPVLFLAGWASDILSWLPQRRLADQFRLIFLDNRGVGRTRAPLSGLTLGDMAADAAALLDHLGEESVAVVGHSMGGLIAQRLLLEYPQRVSSAVLACSFARNYTLAVQALDGIVRAIKVGLPREEQFRLLLPWLFSEHFFVDADYLQQAIRAYEQTPYPPTHEGLRAQLRAMDGHDLRSRLAEVKCPVMVVQAEHDLLIPRAATEELAQAVPGARLETLAGAAHAVILEHPALFNDSVRAFLRSLK